MILPVSAALLAGRAATANSTSGTSIYNTTIQIPTHKPAYAEHLSPQLAGFSIEMDRWPDWAGQAVGQPNEYTNQLLRNLGERTGMMPYLRVGANSEDRTTVDYGVTTINSTFPDPTPDVPRPEADHNYIGRDFYALSGNMPAGTTFQWGLNLKYLNKTETTAQAALLADTFQGSRKDELAHVHLANVEIGNEPDFYGTGFAGRPGPLGDAWTPSNYSITWRDFAKSVAGKVNFGGDKGPYLSPGALTGFVPAWTATAVLQAGLLDDEDLTKKIDQWTDHSYFGGFGAGSAPPTGSLMNKWNTRNNVTMRTASLGTVRKSGLKYVLGELNSYANHGIPGLSNTLESAIWMTDMLLLSASRGIERCHFHHGVGFAYNTFQPVASSADGTNITEPHILPSYNAMLAVNEAIGTSGDSWITEISTLNDTIAAYGIYEQGKLERIVVLNSAVYTGAGDRSSLRVRFEGLDGWKGTAKRLLGPMTTALTGITWAGQSFETADGKPEGEVVCEDVSGYIDVEASSVALIKLE